MGRGTSPMGYGYKDIQAHLVIACPPCPPWAALTDLELASLLNFEPGNNFLFINHSFCGFSYSYRKQTNTMSVTIRKKIKGSSPLLCPRGCSVLEKGAILNPHTHLGIGAFRKPPSPLTKVLLRGNVGEASPPHSES